ncbi:MAG TPA: cytochrome P460 family protein [Candidatus Acidoferrales bacterium]|nr:cytochrome P460 family protein [Candidatus Acidoferrales bacterium]
MAMEQGKGARLWERWNGRRMGKISLWGVLATMAIFAALPRAETPRQASDKPEYTKKGELLRPDNYRDWVYLSSGLGMSYNAAAQDHVMFTNVFVPQWAYREFMATGKWPDKSIFVVEERMSSTNGSINKAGHFQTDLMGLGVEVKDEQRFPEKWAYFNFGLDSRSSAANPKEGCWQCHNDHGAVQNTFVQFYPTLKPVAEKFGTYRPKADH